MFVYELSGCGFKSSCIHLKYRFHVCFKQGVLDIHATIECGFTLKCICDMIRTYNQNTISRLCKFLIRGSDISIHNYTSHSSRAAASSHAKSHGALLSTIIHSAGWKSERTLAQFYDIQIQEEVEFQNYLLQGN